MTRRVGILVIVLAAVAAGLQLAVTAPAYLARQGFPLDDAWIHAVYARAIAASGTLAYNPGQPATGETAPLWALVTALPYLFTGWPATVVLLVKATGFLLHLLTAVMVFVAMDLSSGRRWLSLLAASLVAVSPDLVAASVSGMEVPLATLGVAALLLCVHYRRAWPLALCGFLLPYVRPELAVAVVLLPALALLDGRDLRRSWRLPVAAAAGAGAFLVTLAARNLWVSGRPLPATFYAKVTKMPALAAEWAGFTRLFGQFPITNLPWLIALATVLAVLALVQARRRPPSLAAPAFLGGLSFCATSFALIVPVDPPAFYHQRYVLPAMPLLLCPVPFLVGGLVDRVGPRWRRALHVTLAVALVGVVLAPAAQRYRHLSNDALNIDDVQVALGRSLAAARPGEAVWAIDAGAVRFFGNAFVVDMIGLNAPAMLASPGETAAYLASHPPRYLELVPGWSRLAVRVPLDARRFQPSTPYTVTSFKPMQTHWLVACQAGTEGGFLSVRGSYTFRCP